MVHDWILSKTYDEEPETSFEPNGTIVNGIPVGTITTTYRRIVEGTRIGPYGGPFTGGGGASIGATGNLTITLAGGASVEIAKLSGGTTPTANAFILDETVEGVADMILGLYTYNGKWVSELTETVVGGWSGGGA